MTQDEIIDMARQVGIEAESDTLCRFGGWVEPFVAFASLVAAKEREACAKVCEQHPDDLSILISGITMLGGAYVACAAAIRARGEEMTQDEIIEMYMQVSKELCNDTEWCWAGVGEPLQMFVSLVAAKATEEANARANASWELMCKKMVAFEREACAKVCETLWNTPTNGMATEEEAYGDECAAAIRARGQA